MSTSVASVVSHFPEAENGFTTTLASTISSGAATVPLNSVAGYTNGQPVVFVVDPTDASKKQTFTGIIDTAGVQVTSVVWTAGTNQSHSGGATVVDYATATHISMISKGILVHADQDGTLKAGAVDNAAVLASDVVTTAKILNDNVTAAKAAAGFVVQVVSNTTVADASSNTAIPYDTTIPTSSEGQEAFTLAITPKSATNILLIEVDLQASCATAGKMVIASLFQDAGAAAIAAGSLWMAQGNGTAPLCIRHTMVAGTTSATTFKVRFGAEDTSVANLNLRLGVSTSIIKITEIKV